MLEPSIAEARAFWYKELDSKIKVICGLEKLSVRDDGSVRTFNRGLQKELEKTKTINMKMVYQ